MPLPVTPTPVTIRTEPTSEGDTRLSGGFLVFARVGWMLLVALTGYGGADDLRRSQEAGFDYHLVKPAEANALHDILAASVPAAAPAS